MDVSLSYQVRSFLSFFGIYIYIYIYFVLSRSGHETSSFGWKIWWASIRDRLVFVVGISPTLLRREVSTRVV
jgi:hypothetical protein